ncbi:hypothetical protein NL676_033064 [Syzygium grande]|nr:hypothetical protein NL676_033064 [Syzygium grande]
MPCAIRQTIPSVRGKRVITTSTPTAPHIENADSLLRLFTGWFEEALPPERVLGDAPSAAGASLSGRRRSR